MATDSMKVIQKTFLAAPTFAVVGASKDQTKYGTRVLNWYKARSFDITPVHPKEEELEGIKTLNTISQLPSPTTTSVTLGILQQAKDLLIPALWLQPGAEDAEVIQYVKENGMSNRVIYGGPCILVEGDGIRSML